MKNKFPIVLLIVFSFFSLGKILFFDDYIRLEKEEYENYIRSIGAIKYVANEKEQNNLKKDFLAINMISTAIKNKVTTTDTSDESNDTIQNEQLLSKMIEYSGKLNEYTKKYLIEEKVEKETKQQDDKATKKETKLEDAYLDTQKIVSEINFDAKKEQIQKNQMNELKKVINSEDYKNLQIIIATMNKEKRYLDATLHQQILSILTKYKELDAYLILGQLYGKFEILAYYEMINGKIVPKQVNAIPMPSISVEQDKTYKRLINMETLLLDVVYSKYFKGFFIFSDGEKGLLSYASDFQNNRRGYLGIDPIDFSAEISNDFEKTRFYHSVINELSRVILLSNSQIDYTKGVSISDMDDFDLIKDLSKKDSYLMQFYSRYWNDIMYQDSKIEQDKDTRKYFYLRHEDSFMNEYVSQDPFKDIIESMTRFLIEDKPLENMEKYEKIRFFYEFSNLTDIKQRLELNIKHLDD